MGAEVIILANPYTYNFIKGLTHSAMLPHLKKNVTPSKLLSKHGHWYLQSVAMWSRVNTENWKLELLSLSIIVTNCTGVKLECQTFLHLWLSTLVTPRQNQNYLWMRMPNYLSNTTPLNFDNSSFFKIDSSFKMASLSRLLCLKGL